MAGAEIERLSAENGGRVQPGEVVEAARDEESPLHPAFTWDDTEAAEEHRRSQARRLLSGLRVIRAVNNRPTLAIAYVSVPDPQKGRGYQASAAVLSDDDLRQRALLEALQQLEGLQRRYGHLAELADVFAAMASIGRAG